MLGINNGEGNIHAGVGEEELWPAWQPWMEGSRASAAIRECGSCACLSALFHSHPHSPPAPTSTLSQHIHSLEQTVSNHRAHADSTLRSAYTTYHEHRAAGASRSPTARSFVAKMNGIKQDPDAGTPVQYMDDEFFEDTGEMTMPRPDTKSDVWLTSIPKWLYDAVSKWDDLAEGNDNDQIQIGEVLGFNTTSGIDKNKPMRLFFGDRWRAKSKLPTAFELKPTETPDTVLGNTYVFTEKDLPGYKPNGFGQGHRGGPGSFSTQDPKSRIQKRGKYRKAIPKQTALVGHATRQYHATPLPTKEYNDFAEQRMKQAVQGSYTNTVIIKDPGVANYNNVQSRFTSFIKPTTKAKPQQNKAARISHRELLDLLHNLFDEYEYWSMKALKTRTKQPEQFLKEVLPELAHLVKSGSFASHWQRQQHFNVGRTLSNQQSALAPDMGGDDSEDEEMEDVV